ncbi:MAG: hypothetical protein ACE5FU_09940 [Nitrospinota bacterium]
MENKKRIEKIQYFFLGVMLVLGMISLMGARDMQPQALNNGRYQISAWGGSFGKDAGGLGVFIVDTVSGETKTVYARTYGTSEQGVIIKNDLKKPFASIK